MIKIIYNLVYSIIYIYSEESKFSFTIFQINLQYIWVIQVKEINFIINNK